MKKTALLIFLLAQFHGLAADLKKPADREIRVCLVSASAEYDSHRSLSNLDLYLKRQPGVHCYKAFGADKGTGLPGLDKLEQSDVMVLFTRRINLLPAEMKWVRDFIAKGKPIIGIRTASHAFANWQPDVKSFDHDILGGSYDNHYGKDEPAQLILPPEVRTHPVLNQVEPFITQGKLYKNPNLAPDNIVLLRAATPTHSEPVAWVRPRSSAHGPVFYTSLGVPADFQEPSFLRLIANAILWTTAQAKESRMP